MSESIQSAIFTIGHSTHPQERFIDLLKEHAITAVCDVRSAPYSQFNPQFNREELGKVLPRQGIRYLFLGKELGARSDDPACYVRGKVQYSRIAQTEMFRSGLNRVVRGRRQGFRIALMCAEKEPLDCHRTILVARYLTELGLPVEHIHADGQLESHDAALGRLARTFNLPEGDMFHTRGEFLADAYSRQEERIAFEAAAEAANGATLKGVMG